MRRSTEATRPIWHKRVDELYPLITTSIAWWIYPILLFVSLIIYAKVIVMSVSMFWFVTYVFLVILALCASFYGLIFQVLGRRSIRKSVRGASDSVLYCVEGLDEREEYRVHRDVIRHAMSMDLPRIIYRRIGGHGRWDGFKDVVVCTFRKRGFDQTFTERLMRFIALRSGRDVVVEWTGSVKEARTSLAHELAHVVLRERFGLLYRSDDHNVINDSGVESLDWEFLSSVPRNQK